MADISPETIKKVFAKYGGFCAICGCQCSSQIHHVVQISEDPSLIDDLDNLVLLCSTHHDVHHRKKLFTSNDFQEFSQEKHINKEKKIAGYLTMPVNRVPLILGTLTIEDCRDVLVVDNKALISLYYLKLNSKIEDKRLFVICRLYNEKEDFVGMFLGDHFVSFGGTSQGFKCKTEYGKYLIFEKDDEQLLKIGMFESFITLEGSFSYKGKKISIDPNGLSVDKKFFVETCKLKGDIAFSINSDSKGIFNLNFVKNC